MRHDLHYDLQYKCLVWDVLKYGEKEHSDRTGVGTISLLANRELVWDLRKGFPLLTTKKVPLRLVHGELQWFLKGETNSLSLEEQNINIWKSWGNPESREHGPIYGKQWRNWEVKEHWNSYDFIQKFGEASYNLLRETWYFSPNAYTKYTLVQASLNDVWVTKSTDQIKRSEHLIKTDPGSRRNIVSAWNVNDLEEMSLTPCHCLFQFKVSGQFLDLKLYQRSADLALGVPFNIASYSLLLEMMAKHTGKTARFFIHSFGDLHVYNNHVDGLKEQLKRSIKETPKLTIAKKNVTDVKEYDWEDLTLENYDPHPVIKFEIAV